MSISTAGGHGSISGALSHTGLTAGFYGVTPATRPAAYTQTYATAARTVPATTSTAPTAPGVVYAQAEAQSAVTSLDALRTDLNAAKQVLNSVIDDLQAVGLLQ